VGISSAAQDAYEALDEADLLPRPAKEGDGEEAVSGDLAMSMPSTVGLLGVLAAVLLVLYLLLT
jgi:hypothetical protein